MSTWQTDLTHKEFTIHMVCLPLLGILEERYTSYFIRKGKNRAEVG